MSKKVIKQGEIIMMIEREKTALELLESAVRHIGSVCCLSNKSFAEIKATIREHASSIIIRPIEEMPDAVSEFGCVIMFSESNTWIYKTPKSSLLHILSGIRKDHDNQSPTCFCIIPSLSIMEHKRKLHPCYCCGHTEMETRFIFNYETDGAWRVVCPKCGMMGPSNQIQGKANEAWGYEKF